MKELLNFALIYPALLVVPAVAFILSLVIQRIKRAYVKEGVLIRRLPTTERDRRASNQREQR